MKIKYIFTLGLILSLVNLQAQTENLLGLTITGEGFVLSSLDLASEEFSSVGSSNGLLALFNGSRTFDAENGRYFIESNLGITVVDIQSGVVLNAIENPSTLRFIEYDRASNQLFGIRPTATDFIFSSLDLDTEVLTDVGTLVGVQSVEDTTKSFDSENGRFIVQTNLGVTVIDKETAAILNTIPNPDMVGFFEYDSVSGKLFGLEITTGDLVFTSLDLSTEVYTEMSTLAGAQSPVNTTKAFDVNNGRYFIQTNLGIMVIDIESGAVLNTIENEGFTRHFEYSQSIIDHISENHSQSERLVYPNPTDDLITITNDTEGTTEITLLDLTGKTILSTTISTKFTSLDLGHYPSGMYTLVMRTDASTSRQRIIKN